jgi:hypothetical protein
MAHRRANNEQTEVKTDNWIELDDPPVEKGGRGVWLAVAAMAAAAIGGILFLLPDDASNLADAVESQTSVAEGPLTLADDSALPARAVAVAFFEAYSSFDLDMADSYLAEDADLSGFEGGEEWRAANAWLQTMEYRPSLESCDSDRFPTAAGVRNATLECEFVYDLMRSEQAGLGPFRATFTFDVEAGKIERAEALWDTAFRWQVMGPFQQWLVGHFPDDEEVMFASYLRPSFSEEALSLWPGRAALFTAELRTERGNEAEGFVATYFELAFAEPGPDVFQFADFAGLTGGGENWRNGARWFEAIGLRTFDTRCVDALRSLESALTLRCDFTFHALGSERQGERPYFGSFTFEFRNGLIASVDQSWLTPEFSAEVWDPFAQWVAHNYPADIPTLYTSPNQSFPRLTDQAIALWEIRSGEYVQTSEPGL